MKPEGVEVKLRSGTDRALTQYVWLGKMVPSRAWDSEAIAAIGGRLLGNGMIK